MLEFNCDVLVVGSGAAGCRAALQAKRTCPQLKIAVAVDGKFGQSGSTHLMASESLGINAPFDFARDGDTPEVFFQDMLATGAGLSSPQLCRIVADEACARIEDLINLGMKLDAKAGVPVQTKLSGCTKARSLTCGGSTGIEILRVLKRANTELGVDVLEDVRILELLQDADGRVRGAIGLHKNEPILVRFGAVVLASGGAGRLFRKNVNPPSLQGDGWAMAYRVGARMVNMEFFQIGPAVMKPRIQFIVHSHMWKLKPRLTNARGEEFIANYCPTGIAPADVIDAKTMSYPFSVRTIAMYLDIAIFKEIMSGRGTANDGVFFDVTHVSEQELRQRAPITYETLKRAGADLAKESIELGLVLQNFNGGILIDEDGNAGVEGLYAAGEVTGGVHGADRPGGNNLIDTQVFGFRAGRAAARYAQELKDKPVRLDVPGGWEDSAAPGATYDAEILKATADLYYRELTIVRTGAGLKKVVACIQDYEKRARGYAVRNALEVGNILSLAALTREESRGTHYREDFPETDPKYMRRIVIRRGSNGKPEVS